MSGVFSSYGGGMHHTAYIGGAPESRDWHPGDPMHAPVVHLTARVEAFVTVDAGLWAPTTIGERTWLMRHTHIGHDASIGDDCELSPHCVVGGHVQIGDGVRVGIGVMFRPFVKVGDGARIGMGAVVVCDVPPHTLWYGNPAREHPWPANSQPDYGRDPDHIDERGAGWSREFGRAMTRLGTPCCGRCVPGRCPDDIR